MKTLVPLLSMLMLFTLACDKDNGSGPEPEPPVDTVFWQELTGIENRNILSLATINDNLVVVSDTYLSRINEQTHEVENHFTGSFMESNMGAINSRFFTRVESSGIYVFDVNDPENLHGFDVKDHFPDFGKFFFPPTWMSNVMAVND